MALTGWKRLLADADWCRGTGNFPITAYSEYLPPPWVGVKPFDGKDTPAPEDNHGWPVSEYEQALELRPGVEIVAREVLKEVVKLGRGLPAGQIPKAHLQGNPYWPDDLALAAGKLSHERFVLLASVAASRTQDDKGRVRWTLFGASEQGPGKAFFKGFFSGPRKERPAAEGRAFLGRLLTAAYGAEGGDLERAGLRFLPSGPDDDFPYWEDEPVPRWLEPLRWKEKGSLKGVRFLLTFRPFARLPAAVRTAYLTGKLHLLPFPGSLVFWGSPHFRALHKGLPYAMQIPLLHLFPRYNAQIGLRVPQAGWLDEKTAGNAAHGPSRNTIQRTHRFQKVARNEDDSRGLGAADPVTTALFSTKAADVGIYGKPMGKNVELWTAGYEALLDGPRQGRDEILRAEEVVGGGGRFGYRYVFPAMRVGPWEVFWHYPIAAFPSEQVEHPNVLTDGPPGYLTAYRADAPDFAAPVELWPRFLDREAHHMGIELLGRMNQPYRFVGTYNTRAILEFKDMLGGKPLSRSFAYSLISVSRKTPLDTWLNDVALNSSDVEQGLELAKHLYAAVKSKDDKPPKSLTYDATANRTFEEAYWKTIVELAHGKFVNKENADCVQDEPTRKALTHHHRDLEALGDHLIEHYRKLIKKAGLEGKAFAGEHAFRWRTDFDFPWMGGWLKNQTGETHERNIVVRIPGKNPRQAVIMSDHYDTAYMVDRYDPRYGGNGARVCARGADDNNSATAALMLAAPVYLKMSKAGKLGCDVWLIHLTGEEFPSDCMGARHLAQAIVERSLEVREPDGKVHDLSATRVRGLYVADMIAHNHDRDHDVFQIAPGEGADSAWLALVAHEATEAWNDRAKRGNARPPRKGVGRGKRSADPKKIPAVAKFPVLRGEVRPEWEPRSTLYNTDGQIFSDAGIPAVLFMENYDINRNGYHDMHDTMENIDLDYGSAVAAIFIETVARAACARR